MRRFGQPRASPCTRCVLARAASTTSISISTVICGRPRRARSSAPPVSPTPSYTLTAPTNVPDGVIDIVAKAYDDLESETDSATVTVTKGAPCADASTCATGQKCEAGKCFWDRADRRAR